MSVAYLLLRVGMVAVGVFAAVAFVHDFYVLDKQHRVIPALCCIALAALGLIGWR